MEQQIFCDGIGRISVIGGVVRLDLFTYSPSETDANGGARPILTHRIVMGTDGFLRSSEKVVEAVQLMSRARAPQPPATRAPQPPPQQPSTQQPPRPPQAPAPVVSSTPQAASRPPEPPPPSRPPFP
jgi:outer membrane biosynthesis protein TonB